MQSHAPHGLIYSYTVAWGVLLMHGISACLLAPTFNGMPVIIKAVELAAFHQALVNFKGWFSALSIIF